MENYALSCCSTADLSPEHFKERDISFICFHYYLDGVEYTDDLGQSMPFDVFYARMKEGADTSLMDGVDMTVNQTNTADGPPAAGVFLIKVPGEGEPAPCINGYLRLNGSPTDPEFYKGLVTDEEGYVKVAGIAVTITHLDGPRTPKRIS